MDIRALTPAQMEAWRALAARAVEPNPFFEPEFAVPAARHLGAGGVELLVAARDGEWIGAAPVRRLRTWRAMPVRSLAPWIHPYCFLGSPLLAAGAQDEALDDLLGALRRGSTFVPLESLPASGPMAEALARALDRAGVEPVVWNAWDRAALHRRPENDYVESVLASKRRRELRRQRTRLEADFGGPVSFRDAVTEPAAAEILLALEASGWKGERGTAMRTAGHDGFFREVCAGFAAAGRLQMVVLRVAASDVAAQCNLTAGHGAFCFKLGVDPEYGRYSPGPLLQLDNVHHFHGLGALEWEDSCADPDNQMINRLWPDRRRLHSLLIPGAGVGGRLGRAQARLATAIRHRRKENR